LIGSEKVNFLGIRSFLSKVASSKREPTLEHAESAYAKGRKADAAAMWRALAEGGSEPAQLRLGQIYERGEGVLQNFVEAARWFRSAAEQGSVIAQARLGEMYLTGMAAPDTATPAALQRLELMRARGAQYLVGTPKGRLNKLEAALAARAWHAARPEVRVKLLPEDADLYDYVESQARIGKERSMRRKRFKRYWARLKELQRQRPAYSTLLMKLGAAARVAICCART